MPILQPFKGILFRRHNIARNWTTQDKLIILWNSNYTLEEIIHSINALPIRILGSMETTTT